MDVNEEVVAVNENNLLISSITSYESSSKLKHSSDNNEVPSCLVSVSNGFSHSAKHDTPLIKPKWYDHEKFVRGQTFANEYYGSVNYAEMLSLYILFSFKGNIGPLVYTQRSDSPLKAGKRYLSTALRILSWYEEDVWDRSTEAHKNIRIVQNYHKSTADKMCKASIEELKEKTSLRNIMQPADIKTHCLNTIREDFSGTCPAWVNICQQNVIMNQGEMSFTLFGFMGLIVLYPEKLGIIGATKEDYEGFIHLWRVIGYLMGVEDAYNFCEGSLEEVKQRCNTFIESAFLPNFPNVTEEWEHMSRCMVEGVAMTIPGPSFESSVLHLFRMMGANPKKFQERLKWKYKIKYYVNQFFLCFLMRFPSIRMKFNYWVKSKMRQKAISLFGVTTPSKDHNDNIGRKHQT